MLPTNIQMKRQVSELPTQDIESEGKIPDEHVNPIRVPESTWVKPCNLKRFGGYTVR